ncbi:MAG: hypothetical protein AAF411_31025 [Myxococcota bacterium]
MSSPIESGLYRTTRAHPIQGDAIGEGVLVYVGTRADGPFVVHPHYNEKNRWFWRDPVVPLTDNAWAKSLKRLPPEGFYTLPETLNFDGGGRWLEGAIVQLGYDRSGHGILFIAERRDAQEENALWFSDRGHRIEDELLERLKWAPILPVSDVPGEMRH